jgi:hypothetical protein
MYVASKSLMSTFVVTLTLITQGLFTVITNLLFKNMKIRRDEQRPADSVIWISVSTARS